MCRASGAIKAVGKCGDPTRRELSGWRKKGGARVVGGVCVIREGKASREARRG
jgi:hypothetical protein